MLDLLKDLFQTLGTDWRMWCIFLGAIWLIVVAFKWVIRIVIFLDDLF